MQVPSRCCNLKGPTNPLLEDADSAVNSIYFIYLFDSSIGVFGNSEVGLVGLGFTIGSFALGGVVFTQI